MAPPGGLPWNCRADNQTQTSLQIGGAASKISTILNLGQADRTVLEMESLSLSAGFQLNESWTARVSAGTIIGGHLRPAPGGRFDFDRGFLAAASLENQKNVSRWYADQLAFTASLGAVVASLEDEAGSETDYSAFDLRLGGRCAKRLTAGSLGYLAGRVFGGPVSWKYDGSDVSGSDVHHYQVALGWALQVGKAGLFAEWAALGEKGFSAGVSTLW